MQDYFDQMEYWAEVPPVHISLALIAKAHGAKFGSPRAISATDQEAELTKLLATIPQKPPPIRK